MDQLIRETQPPAGTLRSPVPQYWNPDTEKYERVLGVHGAPRAMLYGPNGQPISTSNRLPVDVGAQVATESTLAEAVSRLNAILTRLEGTLDVDVGGQIHADVDLGDVTVQIGEVQQGKRGQNAEPWEVTLTGRIETTTPTPGDVEPGQRITVETFDCEDFDRFRVAYNVQVGTETETRYLEVSMANEAIQLMSDGASLVRFHKIPHTSLGDNPRARVSDGDIPLYGKVCRIYAYNGSSQSTWALSTSRIAIKKVRR